MNKILTVTLNPAIDVRYNVEKLDTGNINRTISIEKNAGGKGINVSRIIKKLGGDVLATGIVGGHTGKLFLSKLDKDGIKNNFIKTDFETRTCIAVIDKSTEKITELLESAEGKEKDFENFLKKYISILESGVKLVCGSGSILNGIQKDSYNILINEASKRGIKFILDTSGDTLIKGIEAKPFLIKPNQDELEDMFNKKFSTVNEIIEAARKIVKKGVKNVMVTLGGNGAVLVTENEVYRAFLPKVEIKNTVGSGDSVIGGFAHGISEGKSLRESFKLGIACGTTNAMLETTGSIDLKILNNILKNIEISNV